MSLLHVTVLDKFEFTKPELVTFLLETGFETSTKQQTLEKAETKAMIWEQDPMFSTANASQDCH
jgi:hypothetical protein